MWRQRYSVVFKAHSRQMEKTIEFIDLGLLVVGKLSRLFRLSKAPIIELCLIFCAFPTALLC